MLGGVVVSAVPASYPKTIAGATPVSNFNEDGGTRRNYTGSFTQFTDTPGGLIAATPPGYKLQINLTATNIEVCGGQIHRLQVLAGGVASGVMINDNVNGSNSWSTGYTDATSNVSGAITLQDGCNGSCSAHVQGVTVAYQYHRS